MLYYLDFNSHFFLFFGTGEYSRQQHCVNNSTIVLYAEEVVPPKPQPTFDDTVKEGIGLIANTYCFRKGGVHG